MQKQVRKERQQRNIAPWQGENSLSEEICGLLREEAWTGLFGEENALLESHKPDLTEDTEIFCDGRFYCITEAVPEYRGGEVYTRILEIGDSENWRTSGFSIRIRPFEDQDIVCIPLYEEEGISHEVKEYVQEWYEAIGEACIGASCIIQI